MSMCTTKSQFGASQSHDKLLRASDSPCVHVAMLKTCFDERAGSTDSGMMTRGLDIHGVFISSESFSLTTEAAVRKAMVEMKWETIQECSYEDMLSPAENVDIFTNDVISEEDNNDEGEDLE